MDEDVKFLNDQADVSESRGDDHQIPTRFRKVSERLGKLIELAKSKTPGSLTQAQKDRMPPETWVTKEEHDRMIKYYQGELRKFRR